MTRSLCIRLVSPQPELLVDFLCGALGFFKADGPVIDDPFCGMPVSAHRLRLGNQIVEIVQFGETGSMPYVTLAANDTRFHHFAIVVADMTHAMKQLASHPGWAALSRNGPHLLPQSSGGVTAFKFCDPDGHPLELLQFPKYNTPDHWKPDGSLSWVLITRRSWSAICATARPTIIHAAFRNLALL